MTINFSQLDKYAITDENTAEFDLDMIDLGGKETPTIIMRPATEANKAYAKAQLRLSNARVRGVRIRRDVTLKQLEDSRADDRKLFPLHVIVGWRDILDASGKNVPFSQKACEDFLTALPYWVFDEIRSFALQSDNFVDRFVDTAKVGNS